MRRLLAAFLMATAAWTGTLGHAQETTQRGDQQQGQSALEALVEADLSPETLALAAQVVELSGTSRTFDELLPNIADEAKQAFVRANPQMQLGIIEIVDRVARDLVSRRGELDTYLAQIWGAAFTNDELQEFVDFYNTDAGKKLASVQNRLLAVEMAAAQKWSRDIARALTEKVSAELRAVMATERSSLEGTDPQTAPAQ